MKTPVLYRFVLVCFVMMLSVSGIAAGKSALLFSKSGEELAFTDSLRRPVQKPDDKDKKPEVERPDVIKKVPRSRRLPKPKEVIDRVRIRRPPIRPGLGRGRLKL